MKTLTIKTVSMIPQCTLGVLLDELQVPICTTLENPWIENKPMVSCIPSGKYVCERVNSPKYGHSFEVKDVPNRSHILFHKGNIEENTKGCILLGQYFGFYKDQPAVLNSTKTMDYFHSLMDWQPFLLNILRGNNV